MTTQTKLRVNVYYGRVDTEASEAANAIVLNPFSSNSPGWIAVPAWIQDPLRNIVMNGVEIPRRVAGQVTKEMVTIKGENVARGIALFGLISQLELLADVADYDSTQVFVAGCGLTGAFNLRFIAGIPNVEVKFFDFPASWSGLDTLEGISNPMVTLVRPAPDKSVPKAVAAPVVEEEAPVKPAKPTKKPAVKKADKPVVAEEDDAVTVPKAVKKAPVKKPAAKKAEAVEKPVKKAPVKKATAASEAQLSELADKFPGKKAAK